MNATTPRVVVGVDGSEQSLLALRWAANLAVGLGAGIDAVGVWQYPSAAGWGPPPIPLGWEPRVDMEKIVTGAVDEVFGPHRPADLRIVVAEGNPVLELLAASAGASMLVVGSRGHGGFTGLLLGAVSANVAEHASCPVLVIHGTDAPPPLPN